MISFILFIAIISVLVFVHELGHFLAARRSGVRVDEFAIGFPPKLYSFTRKDDETTYSINLIPFGGYVKIHGENGEEDYAEDKERNFKYKPWIKKAYILVAGVAFNILFAWCCFVIVHLIGAAAPADFSKPLPQDAQTIVMYVLPESPASASGLKAGMTIVSLTSGEKTITAPFNLETFKTTLKQATSSIITVQEHGVTRQITVTPQTGTTGEKKIGVQFETVVHESSTLYQALKKSSIQTIETLAAMYHGFADLVVKLVSGNASETQVAGPIGIAQMAENILQISFSSLLSFVGLISLNLAVLNLIPFPALDGGRLLVVTIEAIIRRPLPESKLIWVHGIGFLLLIALMIVVTVSDIKTLF